MIERLGWNHNDCYHRVLRRQLPEGAKRALDMGCGTGAFARELARRGIEVDAYDRSPEQLAVARATRYVKDSDAAPIHYRQADLLESELPAGRYDVVSALATVHHLPFGTAVEKMRDALAPGGVLLILGLYRDATAADYALSAAAVLPEWVIGGGFRVRRALRDRGRAPAPSSTGLRVVPEPSGLPVLADPRMTLGQIRAESAILLPGRTIRRHLFWRYSLVYRKPVG